MKYGVNIIGPSHLNTGLGRHSRLIGKSLEVCGYDVGYLSFHEVFKYQDSVSNFLKPFNSHSDINIFCLNQPSLFRFLRYFGEGFIENRVNIGFGAWELSDIPDEFKMQQDYFVEYWAISPFVQEAFSKKFDIPVSFVGLPVEDVYFDAVVDEEDGGKTLQFLFVFSVDSTITRKNPESVAKAFQEAFRSSERVQLIFKTRYTRTNDKNFSDYIDLKNRLSFDDRIIFIEGDYDDAKSFDLMKRCDCYVSLHRAEGFGLTLAESMALAKPTIATGYSGNMAFMNSSNSMPVDYELKPMAGDEYHGQKQVWAEPAADHAARCMRFVYENREKARELGREARLSMKSDFSLDAVGNRAHSRLEDIFSK